MPFGLFLFVIMALSIVILLHARTSDELTGFQAILVALALLALVFSLLVLGVLYLLFPGGGLAL